MKLDSLDRLAATAFEGYLVRKDLVRKYSRQYPIPTYVVEFLLGRYCASTNEQEIEEGLTVVERQLADRTIRTAEEELFKARARDQGSIKLIDIVRAKLDAKTDSFVAELPSLAIKDVRIDDHLVKQHERMLTGGFYAEITLSYDGAIAQEKGGRPFAIDSLRAIQLSKADVLDTLKQGRHNFTTEEWKRVLLRSVGLEPATLSERAQRVALVRMVPFVERNYNMVELGPRGTGKSHLYQQISPYAHLISGGKATVAKMFVNNANGQRGLVCQYDIVCFDEISGVAFDQKDGVNILKGYMESCEFSRGKESIRAEGGIVMVGNLNVEIEHQQRVGHLLSPLPPEMRDDTAFMDRIHALRAWVGFSEAKSERTLHKSFRLGQRFPVGVLEPVTHRQSCCRLTGASELRWSAQRTRHHGRQQDSEWPAQAALPGPRDGGSGRGTGRNGSHCPRNTSAGQGTTEAGVQERVPKHTLQLRHGRRRSREIRVDAGTA